MIEYNWDLIKKSNEKKAKQIFFFLNSLYSFFIAGLSLTNDYLVPK